MLNIQLNNMKFMLANAILINACSEFLVTKQLEISQRIAITYNTRITTINIMNCRQANMYTEFNARI